MKLGIYTRNYSRHCLDMSGNAQYIKKRFTLRWKNCVDILRSKPEQCLLHIFDETSED